MKVWYQLADGGFVNVEVCGEVAGALADYKRQDENFERKMRWRGKLYMDEQRPESMGKDVRDLCDIIHIKDSGEQKFTLPFFTLERLLYELFYPFFRRFYLDHRFRRGDNTLLLFVLKSIAGFFYRHFTHTVNQYGYCVMALMKEKGTQDELGTLHKYYLMNKKIYSNRFATDAYGDFFTTKNLKSAVGIADMPCYKTSKATINELAQQDSYLINELEDYF